MSEEVQPVTQFLEDSFVYSCSFKDQRGYDQFVPHHVLAFQFSGETRVQYQNGKLVLRKNQLLLVQKNQLAKSLKFPAETEAYKSISVILSDDVLRQYAINNAIYESRPYTEEKIILLKPDALMKSYFQSLLSYIEESENISKKLAVIKTNEAIALLLHLSPSLKSFLFDFSEPHKIDLEKFMLQNYHYNVSIEEFAKLTGRSLASFKRDFSQVFKTSPRKWLQEKRLTQAYHLIQDKKQKPTEIYLELGFENLSHFYTSFKQKFGVTPATIQEFI
ncbi:AraC family transcriptional regulator [uncultured Flavobacterium sp.]|uniref:helix-turn-helix domain-containing protein n=1 Tax=uncultured Flavobacterium sp. TaxID=165435 RepID=UPI00259187CF|nr:AraC family transcriptional regulator [uncultured Flavobacterium sp.]